MELYQLNGTLSIKTFAKFSCVHVSHNTEENTSVETSLASS